MAFSPSLQPEIGPDGLPREAPVIAYTEKIIEEEQLQLRKYIEDNYSKIREVERDLANLNMEMKLTAGPKKAALELLRKKIEMSTEKVRVAKLKEEEAQKVWEAASKAVKDEEAIKQKLCEDLSQLVQESSNSQFMRLEELKRRLEALNPSRASSFTPKDSPSIPNATPHSGGVNGNVPDQDNGSNASATIVHNQHPNVEAEGKGKKRSQLQGRGRGIGAVPKGRGSSLPGWTGAGFEC